MNEIKAILFDADGVLIVPQKLFSKRYAEEKGFDPELLEPFFKGEFIDAIVGKADLKDLIRKHSDLWRWPGDPQGLLDQWFAAENITDARLLEIVAQQRAQAMPVYVATNQERYRAKYLREVMFPNLFEGIFISSEIGCIKRDPAYWAVVLRDLAIATPGIEPNQIVFFDDSPDSVAGAAQAGIKAYLYEGVDQVRQILGD